MSSVSDAYYNAMAKSFFANLEYELIAHCSRKIKTKAHLAIFTRIESGYPPCRRHSGLNYLSPVNFERKHEYKKRNHFSKNTCCPSGASHLWTVRCIQQAQEARRPQTRRWIALLNPLHQEAENWP